MSPEATFEPHRGTLSGLAYRMLGSVSDAEDIVQDAYLRWHKCERGGISDPRAYLIRVVTRLCLDVLKSARTRRETYIGPWLPEPLLATEAPPGEAADLAEDISVALLLALERLSPLERAAFLLHDVFDQDFAGIGVALHSSPAACRQLATRARAHIRASRPRFRADPADAQRLTAAFLAAAQAGDVASLTALLAEDAVLHSDGGGVVVAARNILTGRDHVARFVAGIMRKSRPAAAVSCAIINGLPGVILRGPGASLRTAAFAVSDGLIQAIYIVANPAKLRHIAPE